MNVKPICRASLWDVPRSLLFYGLFYLVTIGWLIGGWPLFMLWPGLLPGAVGHWSRFHRWCVVHVLGITVCVEGPVPTAPVLIALKHESFFEAIDLPTLVAVPSIFAKAELLRLPLWGAYGRRYGLVAVERDQGAKALRAMVTAARRLSDEGRVLAIFPEGTRVPHGTVAALQSGFAGLYKLLGLPVVPVAVASGACYHRLWKRRGTIHIRFGEAMAAGLPREEIEQRVLAAINSFGTAP